MHTLIAGARWARQPPHSLPRTCGVQGDASGALVQSQRVRRGAGRAASSARSLLAPRDAAQPRNKYICSSGITAPATFYF